MDQREGKLRPIGEIIEKNIILHGADALSSRGFTQVPNSILETEKLSVGAKLTFAMLLKYAWQNNYCFPGQDRLAKDMGGGVRSVVRYVQEWEAGGFIKITRRGLGRPNLYEINLAARRRRA